MFLIDNFGDGNVSSGDIKPLAIVESQDYLAVCNNVPITTPDGQSVFVPDCVYEVEGAGNVSLYSFN